MSHPPFAVTVDLVVLTLRAGRLCVLLVVRGEEPFAGRAALPGGFVLPAEDLDTAALRELAEETGVSVPGVHLEQLRSYGRPDRDPRMRTVSVAYLALAPALAEAVGGTDAAAASWTAVTDVPALAFDHDEILADGLERARAKLEYTTLATAFCPPEFTVADLRAVYEAVWGTPLDPRNFHRKVTRTDGFVEPTGRLVRGADGGRPAQVYRPGHLAQLNPPLTRD